MNELGSGSSRMLLSAVSSWSLRTSSVLSLRSAVLGGCDNAGVVTGKAKNDLTLAGDNQGSKALGNRGCITGGIRRGRSGSRAGLGHGQELAVGVAGWWKASCWSEWGKKM